MTNNDIFKKLRVALKMKDTDILEVLKLVDFKISKSELGAIFQAEDHPNYRPCGDQLLRNFLNGLIIHKRGVRPRKGEEQNSNKKHESPNKSFNKKTSSKSSFKKKDYNKSDDLIKVYKDDGDKPFKRRKKN